MNAFYYQIILENKKKLEITKTYSSAFKLGNLITEIYNERTIIVLNSDTNKLSTLNININKCVVSGDNSKAHIATFKLDYAHGATREQTIKKLIFLIINNSI